VDVRARKSVRSVELENPASLADEEIGIGFHSFFSFAVLRSRNVSSILRRGTSHDIMLITVETKMFLAEAATAASASPCRHRFDENRRPGSVLALTGRHAR
jgi:hypothetical protein